MAESARRSAAGNAFKLGASMALVLVLGLFMRAYMPRNLGAGLMGQFFFVESFPAMFFSILPLGIFAYIQRTIPGNSSHAREVFYTIMVFELLFALLILVVMTASLWALGYDARMLGFGVAMGVYAAAGTLIRTVLKPMLLSLEAVNLVAWIDVLAKAVQVGLIVLALRETSSLGLVVTAFAAVESLTVVVLVAAMGRRGGVARGFKFDVLRQVVTSSLPFFLMNVFLIVYNNLDQTLLSRLVNDVEVGLYGAASRLKGIFLMVVPILNLGIFPVMSKTFRAHREEYLPLARDVLRCILLLSFPLVIAMMVFADVIVQILYGPDFAATAKITCWIAPVLVMTYFNVFASTHLSLCTNGVRMAAVIFATGLINVGLNLVLIPFGVKHWGVGGGGLGSAMASLLGEVFCCAGLIWSSPLPLMNRRIALAVTACLLPCPFLIFGFDFVREIDLNARIVACLLAFPVYVFATRLVTPSEARGTLLLLLGKKRSLG